jgi:hypothetical protein
VAQADTPLRKSARLRLIEGKRPHEFNLKPRIRCALSVLPLHSLFCTASLISSLSASAAIQRAELESSF